MRGEFLQAYALLAVAGTLMSIAIANLKNSRTHEDFGSRRVFLSGFWLVWGVVWLHPVILATLEVTEAMRACPSLLKHWSLVWHLSALVAVGVGYTMVLRAFPIKVVEKLQPEGS